MIYKECGLEGYRSKEKHSTSMTNSILTSRNILKYGTETELFSFAVMDLDYFGSFLIKTPNIKHVTHP
jgi:hypothetical protein